MTSANLGNLGKGQYNLGITYDTFIVKNIGKAIYWYEKFCEQNYKDAINRLLQRLIN